MLEVSQKRWQIWSSETALMALRGQTLGGSARHDVQLPTHLHDEARVLKGFDTLITQLRDPSLLTVV